MVVVIATYQQVLVFTGTYSCITGTCKKGEWANLESEDIWICACKLGPKSNCMPLGLTNPNISRLSFFQHRFLESRYPCYSLKISRHPNICHRPHVCWIASVAIIWIIFRSMSSYHQSHSIGYYRTLHSCGYSIFICRYIWNARGGSRPAERKVSLSFWDR